MDSKGGQSTEEDIAAKVGVDIRMEELTDDEFLEQTLSLSMLEAEGRITEAYVRSITESLSEQNLLKGEEGLFRDLEDTLRGLVTIECNAQVIDENSPNTYFEVISNATKDYQELVDMGVLLLNAPRRPGGQQRHNLQQNQEARQKQLENFLAKYQDKFPEHKFESVTGVVKNYKDVQDHIISFFQCIGQRAKMALIVYNGHGAPDGTLSLDEEPNCITNTQFLDDIQELRNVYKGSEYRQQHRPISLPMRVKVIMAQCYGHVHARDKRRDRIQAVSLSSEDRPITTCKIWWSGRDIDDDTLVLNSTHEDLDYYSGTRGNRSSELEIVNKTIRHRQSTDELQVPVTEVMSPVQESAPPGHSSERVDGGTNGADMVPKSRLDVTEQQSSCVDEQDIRVEVEDEKTTIESRELRRRRTKYKSLPHIDFIRTQTQKRRSGYRKLDNREYNRHSLPPTLTKLEGKSSVDYLPMSGHVGIKIHMPEIPQPVVMKSASTVPPKPCVVAMRQIDGSAPGVKRCKHRYCNSYYNSIHESEPGDIQRDVPTLPVEQQVSMETAPSSTSLSTDFRQQSQLELIPADDSAIQGNINWCLFCCFKCRKSTS